MEWNANRLAVVHTSGQLRLTAEQAEIRRNWLKTEFSDLLEILPETPSPDGYTAGNPLERAVLLANALTRRDIRVIWAARGGYGSTQLLPYLSLMLPPKLPTKLIVGFSDISFIGNYLATKYPEVSYLHANHAFDVSLTSHPVQWSLLKSCLQAPEKVKTLCSFNTNVKQMGGPKKINKLEGVLFPINLSLLESYCCVQDLKAIQYPIILFIEEVSEDVFRVFRKLDSAVNSGFMSQVEAVVFGNFEGCQNHLLMANQESHIAQTFAFYQKIPTFFLPTFGHGHERQPLLRNSFVTIHLNENTNDANLSVLPETITPLVEAHRHVSSQRTLPSYHFMGIGGTGMAAVAGLMKAHGCEVTGSDGPLYPPMSEVVASLDVLKLDGYLPNHLSKINPDRIIVGNVISRRSATLQKNEMLEAMLQESTPLQSFPSALRSEFLNFSNNIVVTGTHGKTTTTTLVISMLEKLGQNPSYMVGGKPLSSDSNNADKGTGELAGFRLKNKEIFVLEGDEYDSAFFDKGPKFLHYEPLVSIINNIEFDHADIYPDVESIEREFELLIQRTTAKKGIVVGNANDSRVCRLMNLCTAEVIYFSVEGIASHQKAGTPLWVATDIKVLSNGTQFTLTNPNLEQWEVKIKLFGLHNVQNVVAGIAATDAFLRKVGKSPKQHDFTGMIQGLEQFSGVKRRFECLKVFENNIAVFDDFAHHPTAVAKTIQTFRDYLFASGRAGQLVVCFDPRNATMRRNVLQNELAMALKQADKVYIGKTFVDQRMDDDEKLNVPKLIQEIGNFASSWEDNDLMVTTLSQELKPGDTVVFMSSGSFDSAPFRLIQKLEQLK